MEKKNTILLTVIAVATLLVAVVGATFAYFTATSSAPEASSSTGEINTANVAGVQLLTTDLGKSNKAIYPGTINYVSMSAVANKTGNTSDTNNYTVEYTLNGKITVSSALADGATGKVYYTVYRSTAEVTSPVTCTDVEPNKSGTGEVRYSQDCEISSDFGTSAEAIVQKKAITEETTSITVPSQSLTTGGQTYYYYVVVEYEETNDNQNADQNSTMTIELTTPTITGTAQA